MENWKSVVNYEGAYQVSNLGKVKSLRKLRRRSEKILKPQIQTYHCVDLGNGVSIKRHSIHRLVALAFIPNPDNKAFVNHKNGNKYDNRVENLEWVTAKENQQHASKIGLLVRPQGEKNGKSKLTESIVIEISNKIKLGFRGKDISKMYNISQPTVSDIKHGRSWAHLNLCI